MMNLSIFGRPLTNRVQKLIFIFISCFILSSLYFILTPRIMELNNLNNQLQAIINEKSAYKRMYENPMDYEDALSKYKDIINTVPKNKEIPKFLMDVEKWANASNITIISLYPQRTMTEDIEDVTINVIPFEIKISGKYDALLDFLSEMENYSRISRIYGIELKTYRDSDSVVNSSLLWELVIKVNLYYLP
jgi:Tfp pilus assembly protein PilO